MTFDDFDLDYGLLDGIDAMGYRTPTPIQQQAIPVILAGHDLIACAQTGTGKTAAFVLPLLDKILQTEAGGINALILVPTRELAVQIDQQIEAMSYYIDVSSIAVYGGGSGETWNQQKSGLTKGADVVIATPGRLISMLQMGGLNFSSLRHLVLDEADRMLDMGFLDDLVRIISELPKERQTLCFSATMPPKIRQLTEQILRNPEQINIAISQPAAGIKQLAYLAHDDQKHQLVKHILKDADYKSAIIFSSSKEKVKKIEGELRRAGINAKAFHSDLEQDARESLMLDFKARKVPVLVGTDVLSRGIDVEGIELVLNYDVPPDPEDYVHRIGRTARAERTGTAITFVNDQDMRRFGFIEKLINREVEQVPLPEGFGPGPEYRKSDQRGGSQNASRRGKFKSGSGSGNGGKKSGGGPGRNQGNKNSSKGKGGAVS